VVILPVPVDLCKDSNKPTMIGFHLAVSPLDKRRKPLRRNLRCTGRRRHCRGHSEARRGHWLQLNERVVLFYTGTGYNYLQPWETALGADCPYIATRTGKSEKALPGRSFRAPRERVG